MSIHTTFTAKATNVAQYSDYAHNSNYEPNMSKPTVHVVVPCFNEESRLDCGHFIKFALDHSDINFVFVDDGSTDNTLQVLQDIQRETGNQVEVLALPANVGKAEAVRIGLCFATQNGAELLAYWDADLATPLNAILDFRDIALQYRKVDVVFGSRIPLLGHRIDRTFARRVISRICSGLARWAVRLPVRDTQCGAKLLRNTPALQRSINQKFTADWLFDVELFIRLSSQIKDRHKAFFEFPLAEWTDVAGSKISSSVIIKSGFKMLRLLVESRMNRMCQLES